ncbi:MAG: HAD hydrolase-like protein, partial [Verrucomicrobiota bacterium]
MATLDELASLTPQETHLLGIDSDGCVFDSMTVKQTKCFHTALLDQWELWEWEDEVRNALEFVNLYSRHRGQDRFVCLDLALDLLRHSSIPREPLPEGAPLKRWLADGPPYGNRELAAAIDHARSAEDRETLNAILAWSLETDRRVKALPPIPPFPEAVTFFEETTGKADNIVVSSTPLEALEHEWTKAGLRTAVRFICGKELGTKVQHLETALSCGYAHHRVLMIGDAPKDLESAENAGVRFFPVMPGRENDSWKELRTTVFPAFLSDEYSQEEEHQRVTEFRNSLPENHPSSGTAERD